MSDFDVFTSALALTNEAAVVTRGSKIVYMNEAACKLTGGDLSGKTAASLLGPYITASQAPNFAASSEIAGKRCTVRAETSCGYKVYFICEQKEITLPVKDVLLVSMRTQLMNIKLASDKLRDHVSIHNDAETQNTLAMLSHGYYSLHRLVMNSSLAYSAMHGTLPCIPTELDAASECRRYADVINDMGIEPRVAVTGPANAVLNADEEQFGVMIMNLLSNCMIHGRGCTQIKLNIMDTPEYVIIAVTDDGCGMDQDKLKDVFQRYSAQFSISQLGQGPGFGLTVVRGIAERHGGSFILESREGIGTTVRVSLSKNLPGSGFRAPGTYVHDHVESVMIGLADVITPDQIKSSAE